MTPSRSLAVLALLALPACTKPDLRAPAVRQPATKVTLTAARTEPLTAVYRVSGTVRGRNTAVLTAKVPGYVRTVRVNPGDAVRAGQILVELEANDARAGVARARALVDQSEEAKAEAESAFRAARAAAKVAESSHARATQLLEQTAISQQEFDEAEARLDSARAQELAAASRVRAVASRIAEAKAGLGEARAMFDYADITAPFSGRVLERRVDPGALATPGMPLLVVTDEGALRVEAAVEESRAGGVAMGDEADIEIEALKTPVVGKVVEVVPNVDVMTRAFLVKLDLPADAGSLRPGSFARVGFRLGTRPRLVVPTTAITTFGALDRVFVAQGDRARLRMITLGEVQGPWTEVLSGLSAGERVVDAPGTDLRDGAPIEASL